MQKLAPCSQYKCTQVFGTSESKDVSDEDVISCLKYDPTGEYLCLGDNAGRIIIFQHGKTEEEEDGFNYYAQFLSHEKEVDPLQSAEYSQNIVDIDWLRPQGRYLKMLTTNTKTIKFWKAYEKKQKRVVKSANKDLLSLPKLQNLGQNFTATEQFNFPFAHTTQINSISHSYNEQYLLSTDEEQSLLWSLQKPKAPYIVNSISQKRKTMTNQISITCSKMHPRSDSIFVYGMNRSQLGVCDVRVSPSNASLMDFPIETKSSKNFFTDMIASVGSVQFTQNGKYIVSREYLNVKVWDAANTKKPIISTCIQESLKSKLVNLFENDNIFDKFSLSCSQDSSTILTGNYNNNFHLLNLQNGSNTQYELNFKKSTISRQMIPGKCAPLNRLDTKRKTSVLAYHPKDHSVAVASLNCFFIYSL